MVTTDVLLNEFQDFINSQKFDIPPFNLYDPINYILGIGGKRIRPLLVLLSAQLYDYNVKDTMPLAYSIEMFHNFTLLHDDIMDEASLRRGLPTVHTKYNLSAGILSGDAMLLYSYKYLLCMSDPNLSFKVFEEFTKTGIKICEGQQMDMDFESTNNIKVEDYIKMIELKTAILLGLSLRIGALSKNASLNDQEHLNQFGNNLGIGFQIQDDLLDVFGDNEKFGKKSCGDIIQNKKTYLYLKSLELASEDQKSTLVHLYSKDCDVGDAEKVETVKKIFNKLVVVEYANQLKQAYTDLAYSHLDAVSVSEEKKQNLKLLASNLLTRSH